MDESILMEFAIAVVAFLAVIAGTMVSQEVREYCRLNAGNRRDEAEHRQRMRRLRLECRRHRVEMKQDAERHAARNAQS